MSAPEHEHGKAAKSWRDELRRAVVVPLCLSTRKPELSASQAGSLTHPPPQGLTIVLLRNAAPADLFEYRPRGCQPCASWRNTDAAVSAWLARCSNLPRKGVHPWPQAAGASPRRGGRGRRALRIYGPV